MQRIDEEQGVAPRTLPARVSDREGGPDIGDLDEKQRHAVWSTLDEQQDHLRYAASIRIPEALRQFAEDPNLQIDEASATPAQVLLQLSQPNGQPVAGARVRLVGATGADGELEALHPRALPVLSDGSVMMRLPTEWHAKRIAHLKLVVVGGNGTQDIVVSLRPFTADGDLLPVTLRQPVDPLSLGVLESLAKLAAGEEADANAVAAPVPLKPEVALGEGDCGMVFRTDPSQDRFPFSLMFRLTDPGLSLKTLARVPRSKASDGETLRAVYPDELLSGRDSLHAVDRVAIDRPVSTESFRRAISGIDPRPTTPLAATLAIGYVVTLAQRWTQSGLALGDLVYSLPLAPGEQQRIAVVERTETASVMEREALEQREDIRFDETDTSSVQATFAAGFNESAQGGSAYDAHSNSFSVAAAAGGGGVFPFGAFAGGVATSYGQANAQGSTSTWMSGARQSTSNAAQNTQAAVSRRASAVRSSARAAMRLATASESTQVTTKVITNHNKTRALTMQYWEVLRLFDVTTVVEDVRLVCLVPLDIIDFLPSHQPAVLDDDALDRYGLLTRYANLLAHADVLARQVPWRLRRGLQALTDFAADPRADVQAPTGAALTKVNVRVRGGFNALDQPHAQLLFRNGIRSQSVRLVGSSPAPPTGQGAFSEEAELFNWLRRTRRSWITLTASLVLPRSLGLHDVVGLVVLNSTRRLDYVFAPKGVSTLSTLLGGSPVELASALSRLQLDAPTANAYLPEQIEREAGDLEVTVRAGNGATPPRTVVSDGAGGIVVPGSGLTVSADRMPSELSYESVLEIEKTLQWVLRNTVRCSMRVVASLTAEERTMMLERYSVTPPTINKDGGVDEGVPLLSCVSNRILGFYGNAIVMPFQIPATLAAEAKVDSGKIQRALKRFHMEAFDHPASTVALPTKGVLGEAVLGRCPSAEKIDLTRFWNWKDSPGDEATAIDAITLPSASLTAGLRAPGTLGPATPIFNNFSTAGPSADSSLAAAIAQRAVEFGKPFDAATLTNAAHLKDLVGKTTDTAESARKDALSAAKEVAIKAMETAAVMKGVKPKEPTDEKKEAPKPEPQKPVPEKPAPQPPEEPLTPPAPKPGQLQVFFVKNETKIETMSPDGKNDQDARIAAFVAAAEAYGATRIVVRGSASPEGPYAGNVVLAQDRANALAARLSAALPTIAVDPVGSDVAPGAPSDQYPELRRANADITAP